MSIKDNAYAAGKKPSGISRYEFSDRWAEVIYFSESNEIRFKGKINKQDAIAIAISLGVTGKDLL